MAICAARGCNERHGMSSFATFSLCNCDDIRRDKIEKSLKYGFRSMGGWIYTSIWQMHDYDIWWQRTCSDHSQRNAFSYLVRRILFFVNKERTKNFINKRSLQSTNKRTHFNGSTSNRRNRTQMNNLNCIRFWFERDRGYGWTIYFLSFIYFPFLFFDSWTIRDAISYSLTQLHGYRWCCWEF